MNTNRWIVALVALMALWAAPAFGQNRWAAELRGGAMAPTAEIDGEGLGTGLGFEGTLRYRVQQHLAIYAGWDWVHFNPESSFAGADIDFEETGYAFGLRFEHPFSGEEGPVRWWVRAGGTYDHLELEDADGDIIADSGHGFGFDGGAGIAVERGDSWSFVPGIRYRSLSRDIEIGTTTFDVDLRYLALELGIAWLF